MREGNCERWRYCIAKKQLPPVFCRSKAKIITRWRKRKRGDQAVADLHAKGLP